MRNARNGGNNSSSNRRSRRNKPRLSSNRRRFRTGWLILFVILLAAPVLAAPPQLFESTTDGLVIQYPQYEAVPLNRNFTLHTHVFWAQNGTPVADNITTECSLHLYDDDGSHALKSNLLEYNYPEFELKIAAGNFTTLGKFAYIIWCNSSDDGGFATGIFQVTRSGLTNDDLNSTPLMIGLLVIGGLFIIISFRISSKQEHLINLFVTMALIIILIAAGYVSTMGGNLFSGFTGLSNSIQYVSIALFWLWISILFIKYFLMAIRGIKEANRPKKLSDELEQNAY